MTPIEARASTVRGMGPCHSDYRATVPPADCQLGDPNGDRTIALIGDSVAQQWVPAFRRAARENHWRLLAWTKNACPVNDVRTYQSRLNRDYQECVTWRNRVFDRISSYPGGVDLVVIGRAAYGSETVLNASGERARDELPPVWRAGAARTFSRLLDAAERVIVLRDTPVSPEDIPSCLSDAPKSPERCSFSQQTGTRRDHVMADAERSAAPAGVEVIDMTRYICAADPCRAVTPTGLIIYRDRHHLTARFSESLAPVIRKMVTDVFAEDSDSS